MRDRGFPMDMKFILVTAGVVLAVLLCLMYMGYGEIGGPAFGKYRLGFGPLIIH